jgi:2-dehydro-3-deoxy-L-rhamnonate dehydrogenase (NAD+)
MNQIDLKGRVAVITGGAQGIGFAIAQRYLASGARVVIWDMDQPKLDAAVSELGKCGSVSGHLVDLTDDAAVGAATAQTRTSQGRIDILVNNAGITGGNAPTWELDPKVWRQVIEVNLIAPYYTCRHVAPVMAAADNGAGGKGYGRIVNIASVAGKEGNPNASHYSATQGVLVNAIAPAVAKTAMFDQMKPEHISYMLGKIPMGRFVQTEEIAAMAAWLASEDCSFTTGAVFDITGGRSTY